MQLGRSVSDLKNYLHSTHSGRPVVDSFGATQIAFPLAIVCGSGGYIDYPAPSRQTWVNSLFNVFL